MIKVLMSWGLHIISLAGIKRSVEDEQTEEE